MSSSSLDGKLDRLLARHAELHHILSGQVDAQSFAKFSKEAALEKVAAKDTEVRAILEDKGNKDFDSIIKTMEEEELRVMVVDEKLGAVEIGPMMLLRTEQ